MCVTEGFPTIPFVIDTDVSREDGLVRCRRITEAELLQLGWRVARAIRILRGVPWVP